MRWEKPPILQDERLIAERDPYHWDIVHSLDIDGLNEEPPHTVAYRVEEIANIMAKRLRHKLVVRTPPMRFLLKRIDGTIENFDY